MRGAKQTGGAQLGVATFGCGLAQCERGVDEAVDGDDGLVGHLTQSMPLASVLRFGASATPEGGHPLMQRRTACTPWGRAGDALVYAALGGWNGPRRPACLAALPAAEALVRRRRPATVGGFSVPPDIIIWSGRVDEAASNGGELVSVTTSQSSGRAQKIHPGACNALIEALASIYWYHWYRDL
ncbi:hypothetical protein [Streptomyces nigrescens]|uniref:hypothetical protein n=1 Tax=Streptomyces nigrescens TaxID=1920 RepID=UPI00346F1578